MGAARCFFVLPLLIHSLNGRRNLMNISTFDDLITAARQQPDPQRLLFVFTRAEAPDADATPEQRAAYEAGHGGTLTPLACLDKTPEEITNFQSLNAEAIQYVPDWSIVFVAALGSPTTEDAEAHLNQMVEMIKVGEIDRMIPFNTQGHAVALGT